MMPAHATTWGRTGRTAHALRLGPVRLRGSTWALAAIVVAAVLAQGHPAAVSALEFDRARIAAGEWWRLLTCHLVHYGWPHTLADMAVFAALAWVAQRRGHGLIWAVLVAAAAIGAAVYAWAPGTTAYRGMSGVDATVFGFAAVRMAVEDGGWKRGLWLAVLALAVGRFVFETATGRPLLPTSLPDGVAVVGVAHLAGLAVGCVGAVPTHEVMLAFGPRDAETNGRRWFRPHASVHVPGGSPGPTAAPSECGVLPSTRPGPGSLPGPSGRLRRGRTRSPCRRRRGC